MADNTQGSPLAPLPRRHTPMGCRHTESLDGLALDRWWALWARQIDDQIWDQVCAGVSVPQPVLEGREAGARLIFSKG